MVYFVTAIGTDSGKTFFSAILTEALQADYWKPIQAGLPRDTDTVKSLITNSQTYFHPESYLFQLPMSPHAAALADNVRINLKDIKIPSFKKDLVIEGAGGILVPINEMDFVIDIAKKFNAKIILVANIYLGSINHTLLSINELIKRDLNILGLVFNKSNNPETKRIILEKSNLKCLLEIREEDNISTEIVRKYAKELKNILYNEFN